MNASSLLHYVWGLSWAERNGWGQLEDPGARVTLRLIYSHVWLLGRDDTLESCLPVASPEWHSLALLSASQSSANKWHSKGGGGCVFFKTPTHKSQCHSCTTSVKTVTPNSSQFNST